MLIISILNKECFIGVKGQYFYEGKSIAAHPDPRGMHGIGKPGPCSEKGEDARRSEAVSGPSIWIWMRCSSSFFT